MTPRSRDPFLPDSETTYSKSSVTKAGVFVRDFYRSDRANIDVSELPSDQFDSLVDAYRKITWWRHTHADPLNQAGASLRYHVKQEIGEGADVSQRLKRRPTMINKLEREPRMKLAGMADIAGVRARLPDIAPCT